MFLPLALALAALLLLPRALGDFGAAQSQRRLAGQMERWDRQGWADDAELASAARLAGALVAAAPRSADAWMRVGRIHEQRAHSRRLWPELHRRDMAEAGARYAAAVAYKPTSAPAWLSFARAHYAATGVDDTFERALLRGIALAPWDPVALHMAILLASRAWEGLSEPARRAVAAGTRGALRDYRTEGLWRETAQRLGWNALLESGKTGSFPTKQEGR